VGFCEWSIFPRRSRNVVDFRKRPFRMGPWSGSPTQKLNPPPSTEIGSSFDPRPSKNGGCRKLPTALCTGSSRHRSGGLRIRFRSLNECPRMNLVFVRNSSGIGFPPLPSGRIDSSAPGRQDALRVPRRGESRGPSKHPVPNFGSAPVSRGFPLPVGVIRRSAGGPLVDCPRRSGLRVFRGIRWAAAFHSTECPSTWNVSTA
jgi:hypothetical protein